MVGEDEDNRDVKRVTVVGSPAGSSSMAVLKVQGRETSLVPKGHVEWTASNQAAQHEHIYAHLTRWRWRFQPWCWIDGGRVGGVMSKIPR